MENMLDERPMDEQLVGLGREERRRVLSEYRATLPERRRQCREILEELDRVIQQFPHNRRWGARRNQIDRDDGSH